MARNLWRDLSIGVASSVAVAILTPATSRMFQWLWMQYLFFRRSASDNFYQEVARGYHEHTARSTYMLLNFAGFILLTFLVLEVFSDVLGDPPTTPRAFTFFRSFRYRENRKFALAGMLATFVFLGALELARTSAMNRCVSYYRQLLSVDLPFLKTGELAQFESEFAQIRSKADYDSILERLRRLAVENKATVPEQPRQP